MTALGFSEFLPAKVETFSGRERSGVEGSRERFPINYRDERDSSLRSECFKLSRLAGVSEAGARRRNPERSVAESKDPENASLSTIVTKGIPRYARNVFKLSRLAG